MEWKPREVSEAECREQGGYWGYRGCTGVITINVLNANTGKYLYSDVVGPGKFGLEQLQQKQNVMDSTNRAFIKVNRTKPLFLTDLSIDREFSAGTFRSRIAAMMNTKSGHVRESIATEAGEVEVEVEYR